MNEKIKKIHQQQIAPLPPTHTDQLEKNVSTLSKT
jgi:hypothetical protein